MKIIRSKRAMSVYSSKLHAKCKTIGFVPTMGALHKGHLSLIRKARKENDIIVVSIFVNPIQFAPKEDYSRYPRNLSLDAGLCRKEGVGVIFYPNAKDMYFENHKTYASVEDLGDSLCGSFRPGHFKGVATVVAKLFNIVSPDKAYFGQKDAQQAIIIKKMAEDLDFSVKIKVMPTIRENDGLAMSSRNIYLTKHERLDAAVLYQALILAKELVKKGNISPRDIIERMRHLIHTRKSARIQYISIVDAFNLNPLNQIKGRVLIALGVWIGKTRLIDNIRVTS
jgi:pantoate--beta-alanine ligase